MNDSSFHFKQFIIRQEKSAMKVGTDAVLLGSWANVDEAKSVLDIGTGTGIIALMIAQKSAATIDAIDIDKNSYQQAIENVSESKWKDRITIKNISLQDYLKQCTRQYDLIISNPPYFDDSFKPPEESRSQARHTENLSFDDLVTGVRTLLLPEGKFYVILPLTEGKSFIEKMKTEGLFCNELVRVKSKADRVEKRLMMQFSFQKSPIKESDLIIRKDDQNYTDEYINLTKDYYLNLK